MRDRNINVWLPLTHPPLGTWPATQAHALTGNRTGDPLVRRSVLNPLSHTSQGRGSNCLMGTGFPCGNDENVLELDRGDNYTTM